MQGQGMTLLSLLSYEFAAHIYFPANHFNVAATEDIPYGKKRAHTLTQLERKLRINPRHVIQVTLMKLNAYMGFSKYASTIATGLLALVEENIASLIQRHSLGMIYF